ncbi:MAG: hypothetical protein V4510_02075 [bacterium]
MRLFVALALCLMVTPLAAANNHVYDASTFTLASGRGATFYFHVDQRREVKVDFTVDGGYGQGLHVTGGNGVRCMDLHLTAYGAAGINLGNPQTSTNCNVVGPGTYWFRLTLDTGALRGKVVLTGAQLQ